MSLLSATGAEIMNNVKSFFDFVFGEFSALWYWPIIVVGLVVLAFIIMLILIGASYENRILKSINKINTYFLSKPFITEENLVEFNLKMKKVPKVLRNSWQIYMLNREDGPSTYINTQTCIDKPLRTSSIEKNMSNFSVFTFFIAFFALVIGVRYTSYFSSAVNGLGDTLFVASLVPLGIMFLYTVFILIMKLMRNDIYSMLYDNFPLFERNLTKAVSTLPSYVDYEILFTKKEIKEGIPILQQYLEKRALVEQQELEKARENSTACEEYNFDELGIDGSLVLERAMKECETFIKTRRRLQEECDEIETEKENYKKNFETTEKDFQRKLQASRENLESLRAQQEASTNRIESNYIKKQQSDEIKKQQQLEKDSEEATAKFKEEQVTLEQEIEKRKQEIEEKRSFVEQAMLLEFKHYANTLYKALSVRAAEIGNQKVMNLAQENADLKGLLNDLQGIQAETPTAQENLVQPEEVGNADLYEMTKSDEKDLEEGRKESKENAKEEDKKEKQRKEEAKKAEEANGEEPKVENADETATEANANDEVNANNGELNTDSNADNSNQDANGDNSNGDDSNTDNSGLDNADGDSSDKGGDSSSDVSTDSTGDVSTGDDGGKQMEEEPKEETIENKEDDLDELQKKIEEENANLQKQKEEFAKDLDKTISQMDVPQEEEVSSVPDIQEENPVGEVNEEPIYQEVEKPAPVAPSRRPAGRNVSRLSQTSKRPAGRSSRTATSSSRSSSRTSVRAPRARQSSRSSNANLRQATSEIDALNAEMEKLLDSTKR